MDEAEFRKRVVTLAIKVYVPIALRAAASMKGNAAHKDALEACAAACENEPTRDHAVQAREISRIAADAAPADAAYAAADAAYAADAAAYAAYAAYAYAAYAYAAYAYADAAAASVRDNTLSFFAEEVVRILIAMGAPGCQWLDLVPLPAAAD